MTDEIENKPTETEGGAQAGQREVDPRIHALNEEARKYRQERNELRGQLDEERKQRVDALRDAAAAKYGLPDELAKRLTGESREELLADAEALSKLLPKGGGPQASPANPAGGPHREEVDLSWLPGHPTYQKGMRGGGVRYEGKE